jgi:hypothetical protein
LAAALMPFKAHCMVHMQQRAMLGAKPMKGKLK